MKLKSQLLTLLSLCTLAFTAHAATAECTIVAPQCLTNKLGDNKHTLAADKQFSLMQVSHEYLNQLIAAKHQQPAACGGFLNVTDAWAKHTDKITPQQFLQQYIAKPPAMNLVEMAYTLNYPDQVNQLINQVIPDNMWTNLTTLSNFHDRYSDSANGVAAANWLQDQIKEMIKSSGRNDVSIRLIDTGPGYKQSSIVVKIGGSNDSGVVLSAHMDTTEPELAPLSRFYNNSKPGADDDGSGTVAVLEIARVLLNSHMQFKKPIYLIWYAAEEEGLVGSEHTVKDFTLQKIGVEAVLQFDMVGLANKNDPTIWFMNDYTDPALNSFLEKLVTTYIKQPVNYTACGYACSDHASWYNQGYKAACAHEAAMDTLTTDVHTARDTMDKLSLAHMTDFTRLGTAFAVELAEPQ
jgi:bacterial leucyl aminopeptidase